MKKYILILSILSIFSCSSYKDVSVKETYTQFKIVSTPILVENDTIYIYMSLDSTKLNQLKTG